MLGYNGVMEEAAGSRLDGGAADEDPRSSSGSRDRLRPLRAIAPRFAADILGRSGELRCVSNVATNTAISARVPH